MNNGAWGIVAAIALAITAWFLGGRRKNAADTTETITRAAGEMIEQLRQELQRLTLQIDNVKMENSRLHEEVASLRNENVRLSKVVAQLEQRLALAEGDGR